MATDGTPDALLAAPEPAPSPTTRMRCSSGRLLAPAQDAEEEEDRGEEHARPSRPGETESVAADRGIAIRGLEGVAHLDESSRHEGGGQREEEKRSQGGETGERSAQATQTREEAHEERDDGEEEPEQVEHPPEAPQVVVIPAGGVVAVAAAEPHGDVGRVGVPGPADGWVGPRPAAVYVARAAHVEVRPLRCIARSRDPRRVRSQEVGVVEGARAPHAGQDHEDHHHNGAGEEDERQGR